KRRGEIEAGHALELNEIDEAYLAADLAQQLVQEFRPHRLWDAARVGGDEATPAAAEKLGDLTTDVDRGQARRTLVGLVGADDYQADEEAVGPAREDDHRAADAHGRDRQLDLDRLLLLARDAARDEAERPARHRGRDLPRSGRRVVDKFIDHHR